MIWRRRDECAAHRPAVVDLVERRAESPAARAALDHLDLCSWCDRDFMEMAQAAMALRRLGLHARVIDGPTDGWIRLRDRLDRSQRAADTSARRWRGALGGAVASIAVLALVAIPSLFGVAGLRNEELSGASDGRSASVVESRRYDPSAQRLTEGIVLAIIGRQGSRRSQVDQIHSRPVSTDREDRSRSVRSFIAKQMSTPPRTAVRT